MYCILGLKNRTVLSWITLRSSIICLQNPRKPSLSLLAILGRTRVFLIEEKTISTIWQFNPLKISV